MTIAFPLSAQKPSGDLYAWALSSVVRQNWRIYDTSYGLANDPLVYEKMLREPEIALNVALRASMVIGSEWELQPASEDEDDIRLAKLLDGLLREADRFEAALKRLATAFFYGTAYEEMRGETDWLRLPGDEKRRQWWVLRQFQNIDKRRFSRFSNQGALGWKMWSVTDMNWQSVVHPERVIKHLYDDREEYLGYGGGIVDALYWAFFAKGIALDKGLNGLERWADGWVTAKVSADRVGSTDRDNDAVVARWIDKLKRMRAGHVIVYSGDEEIDVKETSGAGHQIVVDFLTYLDSQMARLILGSLLPSGGGSAGGTAGSFSRSQTEKQMTESLIADDRRLLCGTVSSDVVGLLFEMNKPTFTDLGLRHARLPKFAAMTGGSESTKEAAETASAALGAGADLPAEQFYKKIGYRVPRKGERVIKGGQAAAAGMPGGGRFGGDGSDFGF